MNYLKISNTGKMDLLSLSLLGASSKRGDTSKIGMFGSGNKYALAYLLRNNYEVSIFSGSEEIKITTEKRFLREKEFNVILLNGEATSITTEFGKDWKLWQAIRELYCNALDEGNASMEFVHNIIFNDSETHFYIKNTGDIAGFVASFDNYFAENRKVLFEGKIGRILEKKIPGPLTLYRKGIRCFETDKNSIYDYDLNEVEIDEDRLVKYAWQIPSILWNLIYSCTDKTVIKTILFACSDSAYIEYSTGEYSSPESCNMSEEYLDVIKGFKLAPASMSGLLSSEERGETTILPAKIFEQAKAHVNNNSLATKFKVYNNSFYTDIEFTALTKITLEKALDFFKECEYKGVFDYNIRLARFEDKNILGFADVVTKEIVLSELCIEKGIQSVIQTIIEEYIHLKYEVSDETRGFQDAAISEIVNLLKIHNSYLV